MAVSRSIGRWLIPKLYSVQGSSSRSLATSTRLLNQVQEENEPKDTRTGKQLLFFNPKVQSLLKGLTGLDNSRIFRVAKLSQKITAPQYAFLTDEELKETQARAKVRAEQKLQMPPVMDVRTPIKEPLEVDDALHGYDAAKIVFTDITYGVHDRDRFIVVRNPDGTLCEAEPEQRDRLNQIYFPREGRKINTPPMFQPDKLKDILGPDKYHYILDRNCAQFEPDHPIFVRTATAVYEHINVNGHFDVLWSTRHYGPFVFHLLWEKKIDDLLAHYLGQKNGLKAISRLLNLYVLFYPDSKHASFKPLPTNYQTTVASLRNYITEESNKATKLNAALETMLEIDRANSKTSRKLT